MLGVHAARRLPRAADIETMRLADVHMLIGVLSHAGADDREVFLGVRPRGAGINERRPTRD
jgi:hypothetical protein